ncbi:ion transporter [Thiospirochaeta perfilievii]|uniref:Ion transporter n=1 Tax=Thiospirochaeta perfilievii TaxID=252967 RepID=A0A5C1QAH8_9SPIO|nr:ion transporter [Thiospirochaeta perfilievii]QEN03162.1 ion transporter [Thiospirochaeta perfilievii]
MLVEPRESFKKVIKILDAINPFLIIISIIGLFCEYTALKGFVLTPNKVISVIFVIDFAIRMISFNPKLYFLNGYGWVDLLASLPGIFFFLDNTPLLSIFKIIKVGRFFKIIRILRFLRVFNFLKRMKTDSVWVQDRIMKIGVSIVMIYVVGIIVIDNKVVTSLVERETRILEAQYYGVNYSVGDLVDLRNDIQFYTIDSVIYYPDGSILNDHTKVINLLKSELNNYIEINLGEGFFTTKDGIKLPNNGVVISQNKVTQYENYIMLALLTTLLLILTLIIFYMGYVFAKDVQILQLIIDSLEANDTMLLKQEAEIYRDENGELKVLNNEDEIISLLKACSNYVSEESYNSGDVLMDLTNYDNINSNNRDGSDIEGLISNLEYKIGENNNLIVEDTVKRLTPAIIKYIKKELKH